MDDHRLCAPARHLSRRGLLLGGLAAAGAVLAGCAPDPLAGQGRLVGRVTRTPSPTPPPAPIALLHDPVGYTVLDGEVEPACKQAAVDFVTAVLTAGTVGAVSTPLDARLAALGQSIGPAAPLLGWTTPGDVSTLEVVYPQYGGMTSDRAFASVMLVADQLLRSATAPEEIVERRSTTIDVRLTASGGVWTVTEVLPAAVPAPAAALAPAAQAVLANSRIVLPGAARADIVGGGITDAVLRTLDELSTSWVVHVQVLSSGHPLNVFATDRVSNHLKGRAADVWALDGVPVIDHDSAPWRQLMDAALDLGATEVGGPELIPAGGKTFTDQVHQDHVHIGFWQA